MTCCPSWIRTRRNRCLAAELLNADMEADYGRPKDAMGRVLSNDYDTQRMGRMVSSPEGCSSAVHFAWQQHMSWHHVA